MKIKGTVNVKKLQLPESFPIQAEDIAVDYEIQFSISEAVNMLQLVQEVPDAIAAIIRKFNKYDQEFSGQEEAFTQAEQDKAYAEIEALRRQEQSA